MALTMYMKVTGKNQGEIKGSCDQGGDKKDKILVYAMDHKVEIPRDVHTGLPTGQRIHHYSNQGQGCCIFKTLCRLLQGRTG